MKSTFRSGLIVSIIGLAVNVQPAEAVVAGHRLQGNAVNFCQAFRPGPSSNILNRAIGLANVGPATNVACSFIWMSNGDDAGSTLPGGLLVYFSNNNLSGFITVTCTLLAGHVSGQIYTVTKTTAPIPAGAGGEVSLLWWPADNPVPGATDLGESAININCALPTGAQINDTYLTWNQDNGVGS